MDFGDFEAKVLSEVGVVLPEDTEFCFDNGTLFVQDITHGIAQKVKGVIEELTGSVVLISFFKPTQREPWTEFGFDITKESI